MQNALLTVSLQDGLGRHIWFLRPDQIGDALRFNYYTQGWAIAAAGLARISGCVFLLGFVSQYKHHRWPLWIFAILQGILTPFIIIVTYAAQERGLGFLQAASFLQCGVNTLTDLYLAIAPSAMFWSLQLRLLEKIGLIPLFSCSILSVVSHPDHAQVYYPYTAKTSLTHDTVPSPRLWSSCGLSII